MMYVCICRVVSTRELLKAELRNLTIIRSPLSGSPFLKCKLIHELWKGYMHKKCEKIALRCSSLTLEKIAIPFVIALISGAYISTRQFSFCEFVK